MLHNIGLTETLVIVGSLVLLFGAKRLPQLGRDLGESISGFYRGVTGRSKEDPPALPPPSSSQKS